MFGRLSDLKQLQKLYSAEKYILGVNTLNKHVHIILRKDSDEMDQLKSAFQAEIINVLVELYKSRDVSKSTLVHSQTMLDKEPQQMRTEII